MLKGHHGSTRDGRGAGPADIRFRTGWTRRLTSFGLAFAVLLSVGLLARPLQAANNGFVTTQGARFSLNGAPFYFAGTNAYFMMSAGTYGSKAHTDDMMALATQLGFTVLRTWGFKDGDFGSEPALQPSPGVYNEVAFQAMDYVLYKADQAGVRLVIALVNYWGDYGGMPQYLKWCASGAGIDAFYTNDACKQIYRNYVRYFLNRPNSYGPVTEPPSADNPQGRRRYKDDPTVFAWELANEPRCRGCNPTIVSNWIGEMAAYLKSIDRNHLVGTGEEGFDATTAGYTVSAYNNQGWLFAGSEGAAFTTNTANPNIDFGSIHLYPGYWGFSDSGGTAWITDHIAIARTLNKPLFFGEFQYDTNSAQVYDTWLRAVDGNDGGGSLVWQLICQACASYGGYVYPPATDVSNVLGQAAARANAKTGGGGGLAFTLGSTTATPTSAEPGTTVQFATTITAAQPASGVVVDLEVFDAAGTRVFQQSASNQSFAGGETRSYSFSWTIPATAATGPHEVAVGVFDGTWSTRYAWRRPAATFTVGAPPASNFTIGATSATPNPVGRGQTLTVSTGVTAGSAASNTLIDLEIYDAAGAKIGQQVYGNQSFSAGQSQPYGWAWPVPATLADGTYTVKIGVFSGDWSTLYVWNNQAATFGVGSAPPPPPPPPPPPGELTFSVGATSATPNPVSRGRQLTVATRVTASGAASGIIVDVEIHNPAGAKVAQQTYGGQSFTAGQIRSYSWKWKVPSTLPPGTYTVKVGVFNADWSILYRWVNAAATFGILGEVEASPSRPAPGPRPRAAAH